MKREITRKDSIIKLTSALLVWAILLTVLFFPNGKAEAAASDNSAANLTNLYKRSAPDFDLNLAGNLQNFRQATGDQLNALASLKAASNAPNMQVRWNEFGGSPDSMYDFASQSFPGTPEEVAKAFISNNAALFGVSDMSNLRVFSQKSALGEILFAFSKHLTVFLLKTAVSVCDERQ